MEKQLTVAVRGQGEEALNIACREGRLFRNESKLESLYRNGYRIYNYDIVKEEKKGGILQTLVKVFLKK